MVDLHDDCAADTLPILLARIVVIVVMARVVGRGLRVLRQPQVVGDMLVGLALNVKLSRERGRATLRASHAARWPPRHARRILPTAQLKFLS